MGAEASTLGFCRDTSHKLRRLFDSTSETALAESAPQPSPFSPPELRWLARNFLSTVGGRHAAVDDVINAYPHLSESAAGRAVVASLVRVVDREGRQDGRVDFHEWLAVVGAVSRGSVADRMRIVHGMFDADSDGCVTRAEFRRLCAGVVWVRGRQGAVAGAEAEAALADLESAVFDADPSSRVEQCGGRGEEVPLDVFVDRTAGLDGMAHLYRVLEQFFGAPVRQMEDELRTGSAVFGRSLWAVVERQGAPRDARVPAVVTRCCRGLCQDEAAGLKPEGVFRVSVSATQMLAVETAVDGGHLEFIDRLAKDSPLVVACLLKRYLRELPEPLGTHSLHDRWVRAEREVASMAALMVRLPPENRHTMLEVLRVVVLAAREESNRMTTVALATVFVPMLFGRRNNDADLQRMLSDTKELVPRLTWLLDNFDAVCDAVDAAKASDDSEEERPVDSMSVDELRAEVLRLRAELAAKK